MVMMRMRMIMMILSVRLDSAEKHYPRVCIFFFFFFLFFEACFSAEKHF